MSGHSKFANIKHRKEKNDAKKGKIFTILGREIAVAIKAGGAEPSTNARLREIIIKAKANNMPNDTIERSIKKASGNMQSINYETITYEGYGPKGVAIIVQTLTDNKNRTASNVRNAFTKGAGNMGTTGCVGFLFEEIGQIIISKEDTKIDSDNLMMIALDVGALDFKEEEEFFEITTTPSEIFEIKKKIEENNIIILDAEVAMIASTHTKLIDENDIKKMNKLLTLLDDDDDVKSVYHNLEY